MRECKIHEVTKGLGTLQETDSLDSLRTKMSKHLDNSTHERGLFIELKTGISSSLKELHWPESGYSHDRRMGGDYNPSRLQLPWEMRKNMQHKPTRLSH